ncbi:PREDICTED: uncharacterized protein LOC102242713 [Myotis brandtii]|uniref:uncharacterized protein LOC102242713 n=1 Tax=Myotis brandtii TaxID=109478 RepID=UPI0007043320|nr:PREDICTED: uncharacterized protein LOC102242713 [Myotis brandtii]
MTRFFCCGSYFPGYPCYGTNWHGTYRATPLNCVVPLGSPLNYGHGCTGYGSLGLSRERGSEAQGWLLGDFPGVPAGTRAAQNRGCDAATKLLNSLYEDAAAQETVNPEVPRLF